MRTGENFFGRIEGAERIGFLLVGLAALSLTLLLSYPAGPDQTIYLTIGHSLSEGDLFYSQITDTKPPFIHFLFAFAHILFGDGILGFRIIEVIAQCGTLALLVYAFRKIGSNWLTTGIGAVLYTLLYLSLGPDGTAQPEGFVGLFLLPMMLCQIYWRRRTGMLLVGIFAGILFVAKFTFLAVLGGAVLAELFLFERQPLRRSLENIGLILLGTFLVVGLFLGSLVGLGVVAEWRNMSTWSSGRLGQIIASTNIVEAVLTQTGSYLAHGLGITITILLGIAIPRTLRRPSTEVSPEELSQARWNRLTVMTLFFLLFSTLVEMMFIHYQYSRITTLVVLLTAPILASLLRSLFPLPRRPYELILAVTLVLAGLLFSPLPRAVEKIRSGVAWRSSPNTQIDAGYDPSSDRRLGELESIAEKIREESDGEPSVFALSEVAGFLYTALKTTPGFRTVYYYHLVSPWTPEKWEEEFSKFLRTTPPEFLVIEFYAHDHTFSGGPEPTLDSLATFQGIDSTLETDYREEMRTESFLLLRHRGKEEGH